MARKKRGWRESAPLGGAGNFTFNQGSEKSFQAHDFFSLRWSSVCMCTHVCAFEPWWWWWEELFFILLGKAAHPNQRTQTADTGQGPSSPEQP